MRFYIILLAVFCWVSTADGDELFDPLASGGVEPVEVDTASGILDPEDKALDEAALDFVIMANSGPRMHILQQRGGSKASEEAVKRALRWLALHQLPDGGWSFDHTKSPRCAGKCSGAGESDKARIAATAISLIPFINANHTHESGVYRSTTKNALHFLFDRMKVEEDRGSWHEEQGRMYAHAMATIAVCRAFEKTHDKALYPPVRRAVNFIQYAQAADGGWRFQPRQAGDTSVTAWQLMALKDAHMLCFFQIKPFCVKNAVRFFDKVQADGGAQYGYIRPEEGRIEMTTAGLLSRLYLGWRYDNEALLRGVDLVQKAGPSDDVDYNFFATKMMYLLGGDHFRKWNAKNRDRLIKLQATEGHEKGSWYFPDARRHVGNLSGGRLYQTAVTTMTLEIYYQRMPYHCNEHDFEE